MNYHKGIKNYIYSILQHLILLGLGIVIPRLTILSYGSEVNGLLSLLGQVMVYLSLLEAGIGGVTCQALYQPITERNHSQINAILAAANFYYRKTGTLYLLATIVLAFVFPFFITSTLNYWFIWGMVIIHGIPSVIRFFFQQKYRAFIETTGNNYILLNFGTVVSVVASLSKIILLLYGFGPLYVQFIYCVTCLCEMCFVYLYIHKNYSWINMNCNPDYKALAQKNNVLIHQICGLITNCTDTILLSIFCDLKAASIYAMYNMLINLPLTFVTKIIGSIQYAFGQQYSENKDKFIKLVDVFNAVYIPIICVFSFVTCIFIPPFLTLYTKGADINYVIPLLPFFFVAVRILEAFRQGALMCIFVSGHFRETQNFALTENVANLCLSLLLVKSFGIIGVLLGTIIAFIYRDIISVYYTNKYILSRSNKEITWIVLLNLSCLSIATCIYYFLPNIPANNYFEIIIYAFLYFVATSCLFIIINIAFIPNFKDIIYRTCQKICSRISFFNFKNTFS